MVRGGGGHKYLGVGGEEEVDRNELLMINGGEIRLWG